MRLIILGAGGFGRTVADVAAQTGLYDEICFLDDNSCIPDTMGRCADYAVCNQPDTVFYPAFGNNEIRLGWVRRLAEHGCQVATLVHPSAYVSPTARIMPGTAILPKAIINTGCEVKEGCIINCGSMIDHGCVIEEGVHVCLGAIIKAENRIPQCEKIEAGTVIQNRYYPL